MIELGIAQLPGIVRHSYTSLHVTAAEQWAEHGLYGAAVGAVEVAARMYQAAFQVASIKPVVPALSPYVLGTIARRLIVSGESCHVIDVIDGRVAITEASSWSVVAGGPDPASWRYQVTEAGPHTSTTRTVAGGQVCHCRYATSHVEPWRGISPLTLAGTTGKLASNLEAALRNETAAAAAGEVGSIVPLPTDAGAESDPDNPEDEGDPFAPLKSTLRRLMGRTGLVETSSSGYGEGRAAAPQDDWKPRRIGPDPPESLGVLREAVETTTLAVCGVPVDLVRSGGTDRECYRRFLHMSVQPLAAVIAAECADKLDTPGLGLTFGSLHAGDISGKARAYQSLRKGGMDDAEARQMVGLGDA